MNAALPYAPPPPGNRPLFRQLRPESAILSPGQAINMTGIAARSAFEDVATWSEIDSRSPLLVLDHPPCQRLAKASPAHMLLRRLKRGLRLAAHATASLIGTGAIVLSLYLFFGA
ncbi:hypothetical protein SAMN04515647_3684 [Cohaesibacter sp. ES.047]|nr:hypothetical protein SAMN04515647_3684 [Cohaesibacter sp. ES.047]